MPLPIRCYLVSVYHNAGGRRIKAFESGGDKGNCWLALRLYHYPAVRHHCVAAYHSRSTTHTQNQNFLKTPLTTTN